MKEKLLKSMVLLTFLICLILFPQKAFATTKTREEALQWVRSQVGKSIDADGYAGAQCVDLILAYYDFLGASRASGNAIDYTYNALPDGWSRIQGAQPQPGDILVYSSGYGHVAIYESDRSHYHQNFNYHSYVENVSYMYNGLTNPYWGVIRPNFATKTVTPPVISDIQIIEQDSQGYVVQCKASAEAGISRVQFPTWTTANGQDDIFKDWGNSAAASGYKYGDYYRYRVNISDHNNEHGLYATHIYAYDSKGNYVSSGTPGAVISAGVTPQEIVKYENALLSVFNENLSWNDMNNFATKAGSRLASVPNEQKQTVIYNLIKDRFRTFYSVGGFTASKGAPWQWLSGEPFTYSNFASNQPDCSGNTEFYLSLYSDIGKWNDLSADYENTGFVMETPLDLKPDATITSGDTSYLFYNVEMPYAIAKRFCEENGGMLACVTSKEENDLLAAVAKEQDFNYFLGATDDGEEGTFAWCSGEAFSYTNWAANEPNNDMQTHGGEDYVQITTNGTWNDQIAQVSRSGFICEIVNKSQPTEPGITPHPFLYGNLDGNTVVDASDALQILKIAAKLVPSTEDAILSGDVNRSGALDADDALLVLQKAAKIINVFPAEKT